MKRLTQMALWKQILLAIIAGALVGLYAPWAVPKIKFLGDIFLRLLKMLIAPLVLFSLISGVCKMGDIRHLYTVGVRIVAFYLVTSTIAAALGLIFALVTQPGRGVTDLLTDKAGKQVAYNFIDNMVQWIPDNIFAALTAGNTCNMNGMAVGIGVISVFASNLFGRPITLGACIQFIFLGLVLSVGAAGVKGAGIVMSSVLLQTVGMPLTLVPILAAIWPVIDICHTTCNVSGDMCGTIIVAKSLNALDEKLFNS